MEPIDFWLAKAEFYGRIGKRQSALRCLRIAYRCNPSWKVGAAIAMAIQTLST